MLRDTNANGGRFGSGGYLGWQSTMVDIDRDTADNEAINVQLAKPKDVSKHIKR